MMLTHAPYDATPDSPDYLQAKSVNGTKEPRHFPDMVAYTDKLIGRLVAKLDELKLRDNTVLIILGDNGTGKGTPSRFKGSDVLGGKGTSTMWGTHVPGIGSWPGHFASGKVCGDMIDVTDFLPTICEAAGVKVPAELKIDGRSFLPQLRGEKGRSRDGLYVWYNPGGGESAKFEFVHDQQYKLYADGNFYDVAKDDREVSPLADAALDDSAQAAKAKLQALLKQHAGPRDEAFAKQGTAFNGEMGEDADGNKVAKHAAKKVAKTAAKNAENADSRAARFAARDANNDGKISAEEFMSSASEKANAKERFNKYDAAHDGFISSEEFSNTGGKPK
jgi:arylsulfatase A